MMRTIAASLALLALSLPASAADLMKNAVTGKPEIKRIDVISFGPEGLLLIGDGAGSQVFGIQLDDAKSKPQVKENIEKIDEKVAAALGTTADKAPIVDVAVNPASGMVYLATGNALVTVGEKGKLGEVSLEKVKYVRIPLVGENNAKLSRITDVAFAFDRLLVAGASSDAFVSKMFVVPTPLPHDGKADIYSAETFHVAHGKWETKAPMSTILPYENKGKKYLLGAFNCTPIVKYPLDDVKSGAKVKGLSVVELGSGNRPVDMFVYEKDGKSYMLINTERFHHDKAPIGRSKYWTARVEVELLAEEDKINEKAAWRINGKREPINDKIKMIEDYFYVVHMDKLDKDRAITLKKQKDDDKGFDLVILPLP